MEYLLALAFFIIAMIYASVGFGGGSSYLALMAVAAVSMDIMRPAALLCNIIVVAGGTWIFYKEGLVNLRKTWPFLASSVPLAFAGGIWPIRENTFFLILGSVLVFASLALWFQEKFQNQDHARPMTTPAALSVGGAIGFLSGLVSIGGGIFLSPVLHMIRWDDARRISAVASIFILVNSVSGLAGQLSRAGELDIKFIAPLLLAVFAGGQIGSRLGARYFNTTAIRKITAVLILIAGLNILVNHL